MTLGKVTRPKGVRVTVERWDGGDDNWSEILFGDGHGISGRWVLVKRIAGLPLKPGESVTGRMVFVPDKGKR